MTDVMSARKRSALMSRIRGRNTTPEREVCAALRELQIRFSKHRRVLPGCTPDIVISRERIAIFVDGDFWHGWRFASWEHKLTPFWREKIAGNRARDQRNRRRLRRLGWTVVRIWEHEVERDLDAAVRRVVSSRDRGV